MLLCSIWRARVCVFVFVMVFLCKVDAFYQQSEDTFVGSRIFKGLFDVMLRGKSQGFVGMVGAQSWRMQTFLCSFFGPS